MTPDEVMRMSGDHSLLLRPGSPPVIAQKLRYYADAEFRELTDAQARP
jgi:type IV secretion system protein VirD4